MTEIEFLESKGKYFHLRLMKYVTTNAEMSEGNELDKVIEANAVLSFQFDQGRYTIRWSDLVERFENDILEFKIEFPEIEFENPLCN
jgi:hypothetical protein